MKWVITILTVASATLRFVSAAPAGVTDGLAAYYKFDGDANDASENGHDGTVYGATLTAGISGGAYRFDGVDDYIKADATGLPTGVRTVALWFYANTVENHPGLLGYGGQGCGTSWLMIVNNRGTSPPCFQMQSHCENNEIDWPYDTPPVGAWYHFALATDSAGTTMYVNGESKAANATFVQNTYVDRTDLAIGVIVGPYGVAPYVDDNTSYLSGVIDEVRIYNRVLSEEEVRQLALAGACCNPIDGSCNLTLPDACPYGWQGVGTPCNPNPCIMGACCSPTACVILPEPSCPAYFSGYLTDCEPNPCTSAVEGEPELLVAPGVWAIPNPVSGDVAMRIAGPAATEATVLIFDASGRLVRTVWEGALTGQAFEVTWDGRDDTLEELPSGVYFARIQTTNGAATAKVTLTR